MTSLSAIPAEGDVHTLCAPKLTASTPSLVD